MYPEDAVTLFLICVAIFGTGLAGWFSLRKALCFFIGCLGAVAAPFFILFVLFYEANMGYAGAAVLIVALLSLPLGFWLGCWLAHTQLISAGFGAGLAATPRRMAAAVLMVAAVAIFMIGWLNAWHFF